MTERELRDRVRQAAERDLQQGLPRLLIRLGRPQAAHRIVQRRTLKRMTMTPLGIQRRV